MNPLTEGKKITLGYDYFATGFTGPQLSEAYYRLVADKGQERLLFETATIAQIDEVYNPGDACDENDRMTTEEMVMEAIRVQRFARTDTKMAALVRVFNGYLKDKNIEAQAPIIGKPKKSGLFATVTVQIPFSDGQVVSIVFHSPDNNKMKITADDEIIAFRWLLNKRDITHVVSPENDAEVSLQEIGKRTAQLVEKNSDRFQVMQKDLVEQQKTLDELKGQADEAVKRHDDLMAGLKNGQDAAETMNVKISNLNDRIEKQKAFNEDLQGKIDALKAQQAGNDGKATGGSTPADEAAMKAEQEQASLEEKKTTYESELTGRGFVKRAGPGNEGPKTFYDNDGAEMIFSIDLDPSKQRFEFIATGRQFMPNGKTWASKTAAGIDAQWTKAIKKLDEKLLEREKNTDAARARFVATATSDDVVTMTEADYAADLKRYDLGRSTMDPVKSLWAWAIRDRLEGSGITEPQELMRKFLGLYGKAIGDDARSHVRVSLAYSIEKVDGYKDDPDLQNIRNNVTNHYDDVAQIIAGIASGTKSNSNAETDYQKERADREKLIVEQNRLIEVGIAAVPGVRLQDAEEAGKLSEMKGRGELTQEEWDKYVADLAAANKITAPEPVTPPVEFKAVQVLNDILSGKYDDDSTKLGEALDQAAVELEKEGKAEEYDGLLNQTADYLTNQLSKLAAAA